MQVLKDYVRMNILSSAKKEFLGNGYAKASMREIAQNAGITVGNIYRYYESKEYLFEAVVDPTFIEITDLFQNIQLDDSDTYEKKDYLTFRNAFAEQLMKIVVENKEEIVILIKCAEGTKYKGAKSQFAEIIEMKVNHYVVDAVQKNGTSFNKSMISRVISKSVIDGLTELIVYNGLHDLRQLENDVKLLMDLYFNNILSRFEY